MNEPIDYFFQTSPKKWDITDAINIYDGSKQYDSFISLLEEIQHDLGVVVARQPTFQRYATSIMVRIGVYNNLNCLKREEVDVDALIREVVLQTWNDIP